MSHATLTVILDGTLTEDELNDAIAELMDRYDENKDTPRYVKYTREALIEHGREQIAEYRDRVYAEYLADPAAYRAAREHASPHHFAYLDGTGEDGGFPAKLTWTDDQVYAYEVQYYDDEERGPQGEVYSTYNPDSKWDWYTIGGRWAGYWPVLAQADPQPATVESYDAVRVFADITSSTNPEAGKADRAYVDERAARAGQWQDVARKMDIDFGHPDLYPATFAVLTPDGIWHEKGRMGWFGMSSGDKEQDAWNAEYRALVDAAADNAWFVLIDYHI